MCDAFPDSHGLCRAMIQASPLAIVAVDGEAKVALWNPAKERIFGWPEEDVLGQPRPYLPEGARVATGSTGAASGGMAP